MKWIHVALIAAGTGIAGFLAGAGVGLLGGVVGGGTAGVLVGVTGGMCTTVETAVTEGTLTQLEVEQLGNRIGQIVRQNNAEFAETLIKDINAVVSTSDVPVSVGDDSPTCETFLAQIKQGIQANR